MRFLCASTASYSRACRQAVRVKQCHVMPSTTSSSSYWKMDFFPRITDFHSSTSIASYSHLAKANTGCESTLKKLQLHHNRLWSIGSSDKICVASSKANSVSTSTTMLSSSHPGSRFQRFWGYPLLFVSAATLLLSSAFSSHETAKLEKENGNSKATNTTGTNQESFPSLLATSGLYLDPRVSLIYQRDIVVDDRHRGGEHGGRKGKDDDDKGSEGEESVTLVTSTNSSGERICNLPYELSVRAIKGRRLTMEDTYFVGAGGRFVAVFDGHGGPLVSSYLRENLYRLVVKALQQKCWEIDDIAQTTKEQGNNPNQTPPPTASIASHVAALRSAFSEAEGHVLKQQALNKQGSTAVAVWVHEASDGTRTLVSANVGDSRAILSRQGKAVDLTQDHKPNEEREKARIKRHGGTIEWDALAKVHRVESLSLSRAIGDRYAKPVVSGDVDIKLFPVVEEKDEFIVLASDGLWDVMSSQDVVSYISRRFEMELANKERTSDEDWENHRLVVRRNMARSIVREAVRRGTGDNVCVLVVWLKG